MEDDLHPSEDDPSLRYFVWPEYIQAFGQLTTDNVFDYFMASQFYDRQSNNAVLRMQTIHSGTRIENEEEELKRFTGIEFAIVHADPPAFFIIHKRERSSPDEVKPLVAYYIENNRIYQAPTLYNILGHRLRTAAIHLQNSLDILRKHRPDFRPRTGYIWPIVENRTVSDVVKGKAEVEAPGETTAMDVDGADKGDQDTSTPGGGPHSKRRKFEGSDTGVTNENRQQNVAPLLWAMRTTAMHSQSSFYARVDAEIASAESGPGSNTPAVAANAKSRTGTPVAPTPGSNVNPSQSKGASGSTSVQKEGTQPVKGIPGAGKKKRKRTGTSITPAPNA